MAHDPYGYAWNAEIICGACVRDRLIAALVDETATPRTALIGLPTEELCARYAFVEFGVTREKMGQLDTAEFPQPSWDSETLADSCGSCLTRIEDTL